MVSGTGISRRRAALGNVQCQLFCDMVAHNSWTEWCASAGRAYIQHHNSNSNEHTEAVVHARHLRIVCVHDKPTRRTRVRCRRQWVWGVYVRTNDQEVHPKHHTAVLVPSDARTHGKPAMLRGWQHVHAMFVPADYCAE